VYKFLLSLTLALAALLQPVGGSTPGQAALAAARVPLSQDLQLFTTEEAAQRHCPKDVVVWLNTNSGIYHEKGMRWYGNTKHGAFVCRKEADAAGDRDTRNGQ
jgi:hypothetical protein